MCGYCIESNMICAILHPGFKGEAIDLHNNYLESFLQEADDLISALNRAKGVDNFDSCIDIVLYRLFESYVFHGFDQKVYKKVVSVFGEKNIASQLEHMRSVTKDQDIGRQWDRLYDADIYNNREKWTAFMSNQKQLMADSLNTLTYYHDWWIEGDGRKTIDGSERMDKSGIYDPIYDTPSEEWENFYNKFPAFYYSLICLLKYADNSEMLDKIALMCPAGVPLFEGYDLWLQRKAVIGYVRHHGISGLFEQYDKIRCILVYYALLKCDASVHDMRMAIPLLEKYRLSENSDSYEAEIHIENIFDLIDYKENQSPGKVK